MATKPLHIVPKTGFAGMLENWQSDLLAAFSVSLVALPLALGIAVAAGMPPMSGILACIIGGIVTTWFRGSHLAINGPSAGIVAVILSSLASLDDGSGKTLNYVLAAIVVSGALQVLFGKLKLGSYADVFHPSVIRGIMSGIGVIIFAKQIHIALGTNPPQGEIIDNLADIFSHLPHINPYVAVISLLGFILLFFHSRISYKFFHLIPAPMFILVLSIPFVFTFNFFESHEQELFGNLYSLGPELMLDVPENLLKAVIYPDFSKIDTMAFWLAVLAISIISSIESLAASKAVDKLDQYRRKTDLNKDLVGIGISTMVSGALGGLPIVTVIVRSTVNVNNYAKTRWSNLYHGLLVLAFVVALAPFIQLIPLCALATILVHTGFKLASPKVLRQVYDQGLEQLIFFSGTLLITLYTNLLMGIFGGLLLTLTIHILLARVPIHAFFKMVFDSGTNLFVKKDGSYLLKIKGIANFLSVFIIDKLLMEIPASSRVKIDLSEARLIDLSIMENLYEFQRDHENEGGKVELIGMEGHVSSSEHKLAIKLLMSSPHKLTNRQIGLKNLAEEYSWKFKSEYDSDVDYLQTFYYFKSRPIEYKSNCISGSENGISWEIADVTFEEGALLATEEYNTTLGLILLPFSIPKFVIEKKGLLRRYLDFRSHKDIDYIIYDDFSDDFKVKVENKDEMTEFLGEELKKFVEGSDIHHLESNGEAILIFSDEFKFAQLREYTKMLSFTTELRKLILSHQLN